MSERVEVFPRYTGGSPAPLYREYAIRIGERNFPIPPIGRDTRA